MSTLDKTVLVTDYTWSDTDIEAAILAEAGARLLIAETGSEDELLDLVVEADGILTCFKTVSERVIRAGKRLQVIGRYGIGVDNIAVATATELGIPVTNVPAYCLDEVAEHVLALLLSVARSIVRYDRHVHLGDWALSNGLPLRRIAGQTLGIIGYGKIGAALALKARGLGLQILAYSPSAGTGTTDSLGTRFASLETVLSESDFVSLHVPLNARTHHLIDAARLSLMKPTATLINTARGGIVDTSALAEALQNGTIAAAALDVFSPEPLPGDHPLLSLPNVIATPHVAFYSEESIVELETKAARNVANILHGRRPESIVNPNVLQLNRWAHLL